MANLIEVGDIQRAIRAAAFKKAAQLYNARNMKRWGINKPTTTQIRGVFRLGYAALKKRHPKTKWLQDRYKPVWISRLDYYAARGGKPIMEELLDIIAKLGDVPLEIAPPARFTRLPAVRRPDAPFPDERGID